MRIVDISFFIEENLYKRTACSDTLQNDKTERKKWG